jgi:hypothetical protein
MTVTSITESVRQALVVWHGSFNDTAHPSISAYSSPDSDMGKRMKQSENIQKPQDNCDYYDSVQNGLDLSLHWNKAIDQPKQDPDHDQNY